MVGSTKPRAIGFNHVALEVGDIEEALERSSHLTFYRTKDEIRRLTPREASYARSIR